MPRNEDFPAVVQAEVDEQQRRPVAAQDERGPMGLLKRISHSLGRREDEESEQEAPAEPASERRQLSAEASKYAPRNGGTDKLGRSTPVNQDQSEEDQLEIPAFLRRQAM